MGRVTWHAVDGDGRALSTGRAPAGRGHPSPAAALAAAPVASWPLTVVGEDGRRVRFAAAVGSGGDAVSALLDQLTAPGLGSVDVERLAPATPAGRVDLPLDVVPVAGGAASAAAVDSSWLAAVDRRRASARDALVAAGRGEALESALHVALLLATERFDPPDDSDVDAHVASGGRLWLLAGAVASALAGSDAFAAWGRLVTAGWWPVGPCAGRLVVSAGAETVG